MKALRKMAAALLAAASLPCAAVGGVAEVAVFDRAQGRELPVHWHEGRAWVVGQPGNEYSIRIRHRQRGDLLGVVSVDGVNVVSGETASAAQGGYVFSPWRAFDISGWRKNLASTAAFYFTSLPDSYAARTGRPDNVGVIGVAFYRRKEEAPPVAQPRPAPFSSGELSRKEAASGAAPSARAQERDDRLGTGHGRIESSPTRTVGFERATSDPAETVTIYYDSYRNLVARGVIRDARPPLAPLPRPFPGFVPDPPA